MRRTSTRSSAFFPHSFLSRLFCRHPHPATYIGHPLAGRLLPSMTKAEFFSQTTDPAGTSTSSVLPGSRKGEAARQLPWLDPGVRAFFTASMLECFVLGIVKPPARHFSKERAEARPSQ